MCMISSFKTVSILNCMGQDNGQNEKNGIIVAKHFMAELKILQLVARNLLGWVGTTLLH